ncbi:MULTISPECIES: nuclease-related domain-containing protein [unclassified Cupriavidus]|uniref:nuclease-related domain-containing protein n=1 Tax=unclassified Cupriavidus TaxID=2640874 RepID=UPI00257F4BB9|nr:MULTISPECIES: nuclease-related domain-containing protein [unclassified Cupriavidus]
MAMATIVPSLSSCVGRMWPGEKRLAERLEQKLDDDYKIWYDVRIASLEKYPDFVILHPMHGLLVLEVKDWKPSTIESATPGNWTI